MSVKRPLLALAALAGLLGSALWVYTTPGFESILAFFGALALLLGSDIPDPFGSAAKGLSDHDLRLLEQFNQDFPFTPSISFLKDTSLRSTFDAALLDHIDDFRLNWTDASHEFQDRRLNASRKRLLRDSSTFVELVGRTTWNIGGRRQSVKSSPKEDPSVWDERGKDLDLAADAVVRSHQALVRAAQRAGTPPQWLPYAVYTLIMCASALPGYSLYRKATSSASGCERRVAALTEERDTLKVRLGRALAERQTIRTLPSPDTYRSARERIAQFVAELDTLGRNAGFELMQPEEASNAWRDRVAKYLASCGLDGSYRTEFLAAASREDERSYSGRFSDATRKRRAVLIKFLDQLRSTPSRQ